MSLMLNMHLSDSYSPISIKIHYVVVTISYVLGAGRHVVKALHDCISIQYMWSDAKHASE